MGLFNNVGRKEKKIKETIDANDFYEGIKCSINKYTPPFGKITIYKAPVYRVFAKNNYL